MVSIIVSVFNGKPFLKQMISTVLRENEKDLEVILVDNASSDKGMEEVNHPCIKKIFLGKNKGIVNALLTGVKKSKHKWITFLDQDDLLEPKSIQTRIKFAIKLNSPIVMGHVGRIIDQNAQTLKTIRKKLPPLLTFESYKKNPWLPPSFLSLCLMRKDFFLKYSLNSSYQIAFDRDFICRVLKDRGIPTLKKNVLAYRIHDKNFSIIKNNKGWKIKPLTRAEYFMVHLQHGIC